MKKAMAVCLLLGLARTVCALSAPQYTLQRKLLNSFGASPWVKVSEVYGDGSEFTIYMTGRLKPVADGLAFVIPDSYQLGNIRVNIIVLYANGTPAVAQSDPDGDPEATIKRHFTGALFGNPYFDSPQAWNKLFGLMIEIRPEVIQFWNDNIGDPNGYVHYLAAEVFNDLIRETYLDNRTVSFYTGLKLDMK